MEVVTVSSQEELETVLGTLDKIRNENTAKATDFSLKWPEPKEIQLAKNAVTGCSLCRQTLSEEKEGKAFLCYVGQKHKNRLETVLRVVLCSSHFNQASNRPAYTPTEVYRTR